MTGQTQSSRLWILIPARGGSKGIPYKNVRPLGGKPLILYALESCLQIAHPSRVVVSTDDEVTASVVGERCRLHKRPADLGGDEVTLDEVAVDVARWLLDEGATGSDVLLTVQPTSPFLPPSAVEEALALLSEGAGCVVSVRDDTHLRWQIDGVGIPRPLFQERVNRQWLPRSLVETGGLIGARLADIVRTGTRIHEPIKLIELDSRAGIDIDTPSDWAMAEFYANRRRIVLRADGGTNLGLGHLYRVLALYAHLGQHDCVVMTRCDGPFALGAQFLEDSMPNVLRLHDEREFVERLESFSPDIAMLDVLDTTEDYILGVRKHAGFVVSFEDLGSGAIHSDIVVNDLYYDPYPQDNHWYGVEYSILAPQFEALGSAPEPRPEVREVLVTFGGSDPSGLTEKALSALARTDHDFRVTVVLGPVNSGRSWNLSDYGLHGEVVSSPGSMAALMHRSDLAITSAGRTVTELMSQGIPTIALCQNVRELLHTHASSPFGVANLGLGEHVGVDNLRSHIELLNSRHDIRLSMYRRMCKAVRRRSNERIVRRILGATDRKRAL